MKGSFYDKKIIILDLNFRDILQYETDEKLYTKRLLSELAAHQNLIIATDNPYFLSQTILDELELKSGYLISDSGAIVSNIASNKIIDSGTLDPEIVKRICYKCIWDGLYFSIVTDTHKHPFNLSYWLIKRYKSDLTHLTQYKKHTINTSYELNEIIQNSKIHRIEIYFLDTDTDARCSKMIDFASIFQKEIDFTVNISFLNIIPKGKTRLGAINHIIDKLETTLNTGKDCIYCAINQHNGQLASSSYFPLITHETKDQQQKEELEKIKTTEIIPCGSVAWVDWFYNQEHLWHGDQVSSLQKSIDKYDGYIFTKDNMMDILSGKIKYLDIKKTETDSTKRQNYMRLNLWPEQVPQIIKLINKNKTLRERS